MLANIQLCLSDGFTKVPNKDITDAIIAGMGGETIRDILAAPEAKWLANHCWEYGFIIRYPQGKESITGYKYEPWHVRYLGEATAKAVYDSGKTLEEYLGIKSVYAS